ncbi:ArsR family transcriptional regulator [Erwiniaceae bacterium BAC15a-03b]|uniref:ArsR family transcriptional regulator n=1 Tax=Winslowiella arboricola TaxID=2978220 RepID=A0A9J6PVS4_9GAMM|nr:helix-turn-helix transcriptional regulator [Winslowiella arboricola]MCU5774377.1 ArsR family transcriptional regulator [Winslowiella arboricola]MCU5778924.1 ArsR family transcriptional regulator [Winslowiella arboricola]
MSPENAMKLLSNPTRLSVLKWLKNPGESFAAYTQLYDYDLYGVCASLIQDKAGLSQPATSLCLKVLQDAGLLEASKSGKWTYYRRCEPRIDEVASALGDFLENL